MKALCLKHTKLNLVIALAMTLFFSCKNDFNTINNLDVLANEPAGIADSLNLKYTDSTFLKANLLSPKMYDYSNRNFPFTEFRNGVVLHIYEGSKKNTVFADYGIVYNDTDIIDLRGNVIIAMSTQDTLFTEQLYYNKKNKWLFNNIKATLKSKDYVTNGVGFDSNDDFTNAQILEVTGQFAVTE
tara:strand:+ start:2209 stop:2763 length:555 start_codon:yes stop_codon:yes gene_type:complete